VEPAELDYRLSDGNDRLHRNFGRDRLHDQTRGGLSMEKVLNLRLMANPVNWVIVVLMMMVGSMAFHLIFTTSKTADLADS
jgi:hypothetical protein